MTRIGSLLCCALKKTAFLSSRVEFILGVEKDATRILEMRMMGSVSQSGECPIKSVTEGVGVQDGIFRLDRTEGVGVEDGIFRLDRDRGSCSDLNFFFCI